MLYPDAKAEDIVHSMEKTGSRLLIVVDKLLSLYEIRHLKKICENF